MCCLLLFSELNLGQSRWFSSRNGLNVRHRLNSLSNKKWQSDRFPDISQETAPFLKGGSVS